MKSISRFITQVLFYLFLIVILAWTASLTLAMVGRILPDDSITRYFALALFDGGALIWFLTFLTYSEGVGQRGVSLLMATLDLVGVVGISASELIMSQEFFTVPAGLGKMVVYAVGIWTAINVIAGYAFHVVDPHNLAAIRLQTKTDEIGADALDQAIIELGRRQQALAAQQSTLHLDNALQSMNAPAKTSPPVIRDAPLEISGNGHNSKTPPMITFNTDTPDPINPITPQRTRRNSPPGNSPLS